jgi:tRNA(Arg) A34 adenosine deaminase TadA
MKAFPEFANPAAQHPIKSMVDLRLENPSLPERRDKSTPYTFHGFHTQHRLYMAAAFTKLGETQGNGNRDGVVCIIASPNGKILQWSRKNPAHPLLHAETSALMALGSHLPDDARIYTTLQPCIMCEEWIRARSVSGRFKVYYGQMDGGLATEGTEKSQEKFKFLNGSKHVKPEIPGPKGITIQNKKQTKKSSMPAEIKTDYESYQAEAASTEQGVLSYHRDADTAAVLVEQAAKTVEAKILKYHANDGYCNSVVAAVLEHIVCFLSGKTISYDVPPLTSTAASSAKSTTDTPEQKA